ncbi:MAG TPA: serine/threonine-protein kinase [Polyangiaceae bacterium]|nr:serine/threonine-protein kinase [Polyangiaceae bacterium]
MSELDRTIRDRWATLQVNAATIEASPVSTIVPPTADPTSAGRRALARLARGGATRVELEGTLGEGGMGVVRLGTQSSLGRKVAVKTLRTGHRDDASVLKLMREAWITGSLEHPNIMPIHDVGLDDDGMPLVVLKRIEGTDWSQIIHDATAARERFGAADLLEHNLGVLMQVCRAVAFAHSRGVVHRDIKPENVRIGAFGEVYLLDWGIAVSMQDDQSGRFPLASQAREMAGTPAYMAPEMLGEDDPPCIGPHTDIYLLGATLYEILVGRPPHHGPSALAIVSSVLKSEPVFPSEAPEELCAIARRAMRAKAEERYESADDVRVAIEGYLRHRGSLALAERAAERAVGLERLLESVGEDSERRVAAYDLFGECRFGFDQALADWPENETARAGRERAILMMIDFELVRGDARAAARLKDELDEASPSVNARVDSGLREQEERERRLALLEKLGKDLDPKVGTRTRMFVGGLFATVWAVAPLVAQLYAHAPEHDSHQINLLMCGGALLFAFALFVWARDSLTKTAINRRLSASVGLLLVVQILFALGAMLLGLDPSVPDVFLFLLWFMATSFIAIGVEKRLLPAALIHLASFFLVIRYLELRFYAMAFANFATAVNIVAVWRPERLFERPAAR